MLRGVLIGNVVREPRMASTKTGAAVCNLDVATDSYRREADGKRRSIYVKVAAWGNLAETCARHLTKGRKVAVHGEIDAETYMGSDGQPHYNLTMNAKDVEFIGAKTDIENLDGNTEPAGGNQYKPEPKADVEGFVAVDMNEDELPF